MFGIFKKNKQVDLSWLGVDMHSHLLPGIDDGCPDTETSLICIGGLHELGIHTFFATPHVYREIYPNDRSTIDKAYQHLQGALQARSEYADVRLFAAAEYMIDDYFEEHYQQAKPLTLPGNRVLIEMSYQYERKDLFQHIFQLELNGYKPILAHPERYKFYHQTPQVIKEIKDRGCDLQLNLLSLAGYYGEQVRKTAYYLVRKGMIDFVGTDIHHQKHLQAIQKLVRSEDLQSLLKNNPIKNNTL